MDSIKLLTVILAVVLGIMFMLLLVLAFIYLNSKMRKKETKEQITIKDGKTKTRKYKDYRTESIMDFMEFDTVVDNMISQKDGMRYIMVVECQGINYDLMSEVENLYNF